MSLPGLTECDEKIVPKEVPFLTMNLEPVHKRKVILLATANITEDKVFTNGLFQNVFVMYKMFDSMGYTPILIINERPKSVEETPIMLRSCRMITAEDVLKQPISILAYIEIGMSIDQIVRKFLRMIGAKCYKLYLGNILNIDIETPMFFGPHTFSHHVVGELDAIWVSPHYKQHDEYACYINKLSPLKQKYTTVPYVWDSCFIKNTTKKIEWRPRRGDEKETFLITEPNISFQKSSIIPILALERWYRQNPTWNGQVIVINGDRLLATPFFKESIYDTLDLVKDNKIVMVERKDILTTLETYPYASVLLHQINNEYNYMALELLYNNYPVIHNAESWKEYGYYYKESDLNDIGNQINLTRNHKNSLETYKSHATSLIWTHSPYNPNIHRKWAEILEEN